MKKKLNLLVVIMFALIFGAQAQQGNGQGGQRRTPEERVKMMTDRLADSLKLDAGQKTATSAAFTDYYNAQNKLREAAGQGNRPDSTQMNKLTSDRDEALKKVWTAEQFAKYKQMEASMRQRGGQGRGQGGQRPPQDNK